MAEKQFIFNTNVGITENYATNFFDIASIEIKAKTDLSITNQELCASVLKEMADIYNAIEIYSQENIDEKDIFTFSNNLENALKRLSPRYIQTMSFMVSEIVILPETPKVFLNAGFIFG